MLSVSIRKKKNHYSFVGSCLVSTVFSSRTVYTERTNLTTTKVVPERWLLQKEEDLVVNKVPLNGHVQSFNNTDG